MPRYLLVLGHQIRGRALPVWPGAGRPQALADRDGPWVGWRLLGSNHRELARSAGVFEDAASARAAVTALRARCDDVAASTEAVTGQWSWLLSLDGVPVAVASRLYQRPHECAYNLGVAVAAIRVAELADVSPRPPRVPARHVAPHMDVT